MNPWESQRTREPPTLEGELYSSEISIEEKNTIDSIIVCCTRNVQLSMYMHVHCVCSNFEVKLLSLERRLHIVLLQSSTTVDLRFLITAHTQVVLQEDCSGTTWKPGTHFNIIAIDFLVSLLKEWQQMHHSGHCCPREVFYELFHEVLKSL